MDTDNIEFIHHYKFNKNIRLKVVTIDGDTGFVTSFNSDNEYIDVLFKDDTYAKSVPLKNILKISVIERVSQL